MADVCIGSRIACRADEYENCIDVSCDENSTFTTSRKMHSHDDFEIYYLIAGKRIMRMGDGGFFLLSAGDVMLIPPNVVHGTMDIEGVACRRTIVNFCNGYADELAASSGESRLTELFYPAGNRVTVPPAYRHELESIFRDMARELATRPSGYRLEVKLDILKLLVLLSRVVQASAQLESRRRKNSYISKIVEYVNKNYNDELSLAMLAKKFYINKSVLSREFKKTTSQTFTDYLNNLRILEAKRLLIDSPDIRISDVCDAVGYNSITYFERVFHRKERWTPRQFRQYHYRGDFYGKDMSSAT
jgi:AraC-like DNA-binding protein